MSETSRAPLSVGVVGAGKISSASHLPVLSNLDDTEISYVADLDPSRVRSLSASYGAEPIVVGDGDTTLPPRDAVLLAIPVGARAPYVEAFGRRQIPVFAEKPFATTPAEHREYLDILGDVTCHYIRLNYSATRQARRLVVEDTLGDLNGVTYAEGGVQGPTGRSPATYQSDPSLRGGGLLMEMGCHGLSQLLWILREWDLTVESSSISWQAGFDVDVDARLLATGSRGSVPVEFELSRVRPLRTEIRLTFEHGIVSFDPEKAEARLVLEGDERGGAPLTFDTTGRWATSFAQAVYIHWRQFLGHVRDGELADGTREEPVGTMPEVTRLIDEMYGRSPPPGGVSS